MKPASLDHIGIAVGPGSRLAELLALLGLPVSGRESIEREKVHTHWIPLPEPAPHVELLEPSEPSSVIQSFLDRLGKDGIHHLCFRVASVRDAGARLQAAGFALIYPEAKPGAHSCLVNFVHPKTTGGVLVEISEKTDG